MFFSLLELCQTFPTSSHTNLALWILWRLKNALPLSSREEANLQNRQVLSIKLAHQTECLHIGSKIKYIQENVKTSKQNLRSRIDLEPQF